MGNRIGDRPKLLVTGASGGLASLLTHFFLRKYRLVGVDPRPMPEDHRFPGEFVQANYLSRKVAEIFRQHEFETILHLGRVPLASGAAGNVRYNTNVLGTRNLLDLAAKYKVKNVVVCSTFHVYGAHPHNPLNLDEGEPLRASQTFPELIDAVDLDTTVTVFALKNPSIRTVILRPANVVGPRTKNRITQFLRGKYCPYVMGFDPLMQFLHEEDMATAFRLAVDGESSGIFNVAGEGVVPFTRAIRIAGAIPFPVPHLLAYPTASVATAFGANFPRHLVDYFRYPVILADTAFRREFKFTPQFTTKEALESIRTRPREE